MTNDPIATYHEALERRDFDGARAALADDLHFEGPFDSFDDADAFIAAIRGLWNIVGSIDIRHRSSDGVQTVVLYDMNTTTPAGTQLVCEWYRTDDGKIAAIRALFDSAPFAALRASGPPAASP